MLSHRKSKKAVSIMIGYVLLIVFAMIIGAVVYTWLRSYVPTEAIECPDGVSMFIKDIQCENSDGGYNLTLNLTNNGRFAIDAYYLRVAENPEAVIGTRPVIEKLYGDEIDVVTGGIIVFTNQLPPGTDAGTVVFNIGEKAYLAEVTPIRYEVIEGKNRIAICGEAKVKESISCE